MKDAGSDRCKDPLDSFQVATAHPRDLVAPNFRVYELTRSDLAIRQGIDNGFETDAQLRAAVQRNKAVLEVASKLRAPAPATTGADLIALPRQTASSQVLEGGTDTLGDLDSGPASPTRLSLSASGTTACSGPGATAWRHAQRDPVSAAPEPSP